MKKADRFYIKLQEEQILLKDARGKSLKDHHEGDN